MKEQRRSKRHYVYNGARLANADGSLFGTCRMIDVSRTGARIETKEALTLPDHVVLLLSHNGALRRQCLIVWRSANSIGVEFVPNVAPH
jgi:hypothetical protein